MLTQIRSKCRCGRLRGAATDVSCGLRENRIVCYCDDCQAYVHFLECGDALDAHGGTDIFQMTPSRVTLTAGQEHLRCLRLAEGPPPVVRRLLPDAVGNCSPTRVCPSSASFTSSWFRRRQADPGRGLGPPVGVHHGTIRARRPAHVHPRATFGVVLRALKTLTSAWVAGKARPSPFFDPTTGKPVVEPHILAATERERLRTA